MEAPGRYDRRFRSEASQATSHLLVHAIRQASPQLTDIVTAFFCPSDERATPPIPLDRRQRAYPNLRLRRSDPSTTGIVLQRPSPRATRRARTALLSGLIPHTCMAIRPCASGSG